MHNLRRAESEDGVIVVNKSGVVNLRATVRAKEPAPSGRRTRCWGGVLQTRYQPLTGNAYSLRYVYGLQRNFWCQPPLHVVE